MLKTCEDLEEWVKEHASHRIDGTYQHAVFEFIAYQRAMAMYDEKLPVIARIFVTGVDPMDEEQVNKWIATFRSEYEASYRTQLIYGWPMMVFTAPDALQIDKKVDDALIGLLLHYFDLCVSGD